MRQTDFVLEKSISGKRLLRFPSVMFLPLDVLPGFMHQILQKQRRLQRGITCLNLRSLSISIIYFNINMYSDEFALRDF